MPTRHFAHAGQVATSTQIQIHADNISGSNHINSANGLEGEIKAPHKKLSPVSSNAMNRLQTTPSRDRPTSSKTRNGTIRAVPAEPLQIEASEGGHQTQSRSDGPPVLQPSIAFSPLRIESRSTSPSPSKTTLPVANGTVRTISAEFGPMRTYNTIQTSEEINGSASTSPGASAFNAAIGKANLGKSGRVIERLQGENDMLKREIKIERIKADDAKKEVRLVEEKLETTIEDYENRLHDAVVNKTLLKRRDRQLADLTAQVNAEREKADAAVERERLWREELERTQRECTAKMEESNARAEKAQMYSMLMEARNQTLEDHWKHKDDDIAELVVKLDAEIESLVLERRSDDIKIQTLQGLCDQQDEQLKATEKHNQAIWEQFEAYKTEKEESLRDITEKLKTQEHKNAQTIEDGQELLSQVRFALAMQETARRFQ